MSKFIFVKIKSKAKTTWNFNLKQVLFFFNSAIVFFWQYMRKGVCKQCIVCKPLFSYIGKKTFTVGRKSSNIGAARVGRRRRFPTRTPAPPYSYDASLTVWVGNSRRLPTRAAPMLDDRCILYPDVYFVSFFYVFILMCILYPQVLKLLPVVGTEMVQFSCWCLTV